METKGKSKKLALSLIGALVIVPGVGLASPAEAHGSCRSPTGVERVSELRGSGKVSCATARKVAVAYDRHVMQSQSFPGGGRVVAAGFACRARPAEQQEETFLVRCTGGNGKLVRFTWGV